MKPLNQVERNNAFLGFLLFFFVTIGVIITVIFFSIEVPIRENEQLRSRMLTLQSEKAFADSFAVAMKDAVNELKKFDVKEEKQEPAEATQRRVQLKINKMQKLVEGLPEAENSIYTLMVESLANLNNAKTYLKSQEEKREYARNQ